MKTCKSIIAVALALVMSLACLAGCGTQVPTSTPDPNTQPSDTVQQPASGGVLLLSVNPKIAIEYDENGLVTGVTARNDAALAIIASCEGLIGQETRAVVSKLVTAIGEAGYFVEDIDGEARNITIEIESGSQLPSQNFLDDVVADIHAAVSGKDWTAPGSEAPGGEAPAAPTSRPRVNTVVPQGTQVNRGTDYGITDYIDTDYGPGNDGNTDYNDTDYGPFGDGITDYNDTDYGPNKDGVTD